MERADDHLRHECRLALVIRGIVQGVGFRPFVYNLARSRGLRGWVRNEADQVRIEVQGPATVVASFVAALQHAHPPQVRIDTLQSWPQPCEAGAATFEILASSADTAPQPTIPADLATCTECLTEIRSPTDRRYRYPFTNCTNCGPRWSIIAGLPYDRPRTTMASFALCAECRSEYNSPGNRRFHAQPIACPTCGPQLELLDASGKSLARVEAALMRAAEAVREGKVLALKGLGGFQLLVDATSAGAVARLRARKRRPHRPLAVMLPTLEAARQYCQVSAAEAEALLSPAAPIVLLRRLPIEHMPSLAAQALIAAEVAPGNPYLGVMLPYTPLHHLLLAEIDRPVVCTSGNLAEEPMAVDNAEALGRLGPIADVLLVHDRPIRRPVDDSVARVGPTGLQLLRRARGYAPLPLRLAGRWPTILALGGHLKNTIALSLGGASVRGQVRAAADAQTSVVLSAHIGDLDNVRAIEVFERNVQDMLAFFQTQPEVVACDLHPDYASTRYAEWLAGRWGAPLVRVQHHHAHAAACMAEHGLKGPTLALTWDGTGYGLDGTIWGGEALRCVDGDFQRFARLRTFTLPGGDRAVREPRRSALGVLYAVLGEEAARYAASWFLPAELDALLGLLRRGVHCPTTSSLGRLFDAVAALCGLGTQSSFEGQAAMALEFTAAEYERGAYPLPLCREAPDQPVPSPPPATPPPSIGSSQAGGNMSPLSDKWAAPPPSPSPLVADWEPTLRAVLADLAQGVPVARISARFHNALVEMALAVARAGECRQVVLSGGCFQNALLSERIYHRLRQEGFEAYCHREVPPGDGGIALGQVLVAALRYTKGHGTP